MKNIFIIAIACVLAACGSGKKQGERLTKIQNDNAYLMGHYQQMQNVKWEKTNKILEEPSKAKYKEGMTPVLKRFQECVVQFNQISQAMRQKWWEQCRQDSLATLYITPQDADSLEHTLLWATTEMLTTYNRLLDEYGTQPFGLKPDEIIRKKKVMEEDLFHYVKQEKGWVVQLLLKTKNFANASLLLSQLEGKALLCRSIMQYEVTSYASGRIGCCLCNPFPIAIAEKSVVCLGDKFKADIYLGSYSSTRLNPKDTRIQANGKECTLDKYGKANYKEKATTRGFQPIVVDVSAVVQNPKDTLWARDTFYYLVR